MGLFSSSKRDATMEKIQMNLDEANKNSIVIGEQLGRLSNYLEEKNGRKSIVGKNETDSYQAAYALNLCTVSVSQIIDYNDLNFMEQEYESILNNLNLENMPKDEALLDILKKLLDVITFFRLQDGDRKMMEKKYEHKMKNAIWNAVPNISVVAGGSPASVAISLATNVGIGYMNYRRAKAEISLEKLSGDMSSPG